MRRELAVMAKILLVLMIGQLAIMPAQAVLFGASGVGIDIPVITSQKSTATATGGIQVTTSYQGQVPWQWDKAEGTYIGTFPVGLDTFDLKVYPNVSTPGLRVVAMCAAEGELEKNLKYHQDSKTKVWSFDDSGTINLNRDEGGRYYLSFPLDKTIGTDIHCLRFYALVADANRVDNAINLILFKIKWVGKTPGADLIDTLRFKTEAWPANQPAPTPQYLADLLRRAGNGGNGLVFETLLANDGAKNVGNAGTGATGSNVTYDNGSNLRELASLQARVASLEAYDLKVWSAIETLGRNSGKTEDEIQRLRQLVANHELTLVKVIEYLKEGPAPQKECVYGSYTFRTSQKIFIKLYDTANPQGKVSGPYNQGSIVINGALIGERYNGKVVPVEYQVRWSTDCQNWSNMLTYKPYVNSVIGLP